LAYRTKRYLKYQNIHILLFHLRAIFSEPGSSSQHGKPFLLKGSFITCFYSLFVFSLTLGTAFVSHSKRHGWSIISMLFSSLERRQISKISQIEQFSDVCVKSNFQMFVLLPLYLLWICKFDFSLLSKVSCHLFIDSIITLNTLYIFDDLILFTSFRCICYNIVYLNFHFHNVFSK